MYKTLFCSRCGGDVENHVEFSKCKSCGYKRYRHMVSAGQVLVVKGNRVLLGIRGIEPKKGTLDLIGGALKYGEHPSVGAIREVKEETGLNVSLIKLLGVYVDDYEYQGEMLKVLNVVYVGEIKSGKMKANDDVERLVWVDIRKVAPEFGFKLAREAFSDLQKWYEKNNNKR